LFPYAIHNVRGNLAYQILSSIDPKGSKVQLVAIPQGATYHHCEHSLATAPLNPATLICFLVSSGLLG